MAPAPELDAGDAEPIRPRGPDRRGDRKPVTPPAEGGRGTAVGLGPGTSLHYLVTGATLQKKKG